ncbi:MAG TPA: spore germination protein [Bacillota bacterium]|nr:spore germination protein [Bacillota bacterium]
MFNLKQLLQIISYQENLDTEGFILKETKDDQQKAGKKDQGQAAADSKQRSGAGQQQAGADAQKDDGKVEQQAGKDGQNQVSGGEDEGAADQNKRSRSRRSFRKPVPSSGTSAHRAAEDGEVSASLEENRESIRQLYGLPGNKDVIIRDFTINTVPPVRCFAVFIDGLTDKVVQDLLFQALMAFAGQAAPASGEKLVDLVKDSLMPGNQVSVTTSFREVLDGVNYGDTALFLEGCGQALLVETKGWEHRTVDRPQSEQTINGPQEAFTETLRTNTSLIRKLLKSEQLTTELLTVGCRVRTYVAVMYLRDLANPDLVAEVKRRIEGVKVDYLADSGVLEQFIEDHPYSLNPTTLATERPDRVASKIMEGKVAILVDGSPFVLVVPSTMYEQLHTGEEIYRRWQFGTYVRYLRALSFLASFLLPGLYLSLVLFHHEMLPTELLLAIAGNRERVPFPSIMEVLMMEFALEFIREAGLRVPGVMGTTIGIVGALILGQAAVQANIVSPILVILVSVTGLASFAIPYYSLAFTTRIYRFIYIALGATLGFFGISTGLFIQTLLTANLKSFGVPYLVPTGPRTAAGADVVTRLPIFFHESRPDYVNPQDVTRAPRVSRTWLKKDGGDQR